MVMELALYYIALFVVSLSTTWWVFRKVLKVARLKNIVDIPDARKLQRVPVPVMGGIAVFFGMLLAFAFAGVFNDITDMFPLLCLMSIMLYVGSIDDIIGMSPKSRLVIEILLVLFLIYSTGSSIDDFHGLWGLNLIPQWIAVPLTVFACVGIINAINMIDGIDGLCSSYCIFVSTIFGANFLSCGDMSDASLAIISIGALIPFLSHNVFGRKSRMFMGDGGSLLMGMIVSYFVIRMLRSGAEVPEGFGVVAFALAVLAIPVFDTVRVMFARIFRGRSPFSPDRTHLHHLLVDLHFSHLGATSAELLANMLVVAGWYVSYRLGASVDMQLYVVMCLGTLVTFAFYNFYRTQEKEGTKAYCIMTRIGDRTHVGNTKWFAWMTRIQDRDSDVDVEDNIEEES